MSSAQQVECVSPEAATITLSVTVNEARAASEFYAFGSSTDSVLNHAMRALVGRLRETLKSRGYTV